MSSNNVADTIKFSTVMFFILGLLLPLWPVTLPLFFWLAYRSYRKGGPEPVSLYQLQKAKALLDDGGITKAEYDSIKSRSRDLNV